MNSSKIIGSILVPKCETDFVVYMNCDLSIKACGLQIRKSPYAENARGCS